MNALTIATGFSLLLCAPSLHREDALQFAPAEDSSATKIFFVETSFTLEDVTQLVSGQDTNLEVPQLEVVNVRKTAITDQYLSVADGRPERLLRTFNTLEGRSEVEIDVGGPAESYEYDFVSRLTETQALFRWDKDTDQYAVTDKEGKDVADFDGLTEDMDLRGFLPKDEAEKFSSWEIDPQVLLQAFRAGGDKLVAPTEMPKGEYYAMTPMQLMGASVLDLSELHDVVGGEVTATWDETEKEDGTRLALITIEASLVASSNATERVLSLLDAIGADHPEELAVELEISIDGEGQLVWNLDENRLESFTFAPELSASIIFEWVQDFGGEELPIEFAAGLTGEASFEVSVE